MVVQREIHREVIAQRRKRVVFFSTGWPEAVSLRGIGWARSEANHHRRQSSQALSRDRMLLLSMAGRKEYPGVPPTPLHVPPPTPLHVPSLGLLSGPCSRLQRNQNPAYPSLPWPPGAGKQKAASRALMLFLHRVGEEQRETGDTVQEQQLRQLSWRQAFPLPGSFYASYTTPRPTGQLWASRAQSVPSVVIVLHEFSMSPEETEQQELWILGSRTGL